MKPLLLLLCTCIGLHAQTLSGTIRSNKGELMPFSSLWVTDLNKGTLANEEGKYEALWSFCADHQALTLERPSNIAIHLSRRHQVAE